MLCGGQVLLCDPMLATGGSALMAIRTLLEAGVKEAAIVFVSVVVCPEVSITVVSVVLQLIPGSRSCQADLVQLRSGT